MYPLFENSTTRTTIMVTILIKDQMILIMEIAAPRKLLQPRFTVMDTNAINQRGLDLKSRPP